MPTEDAGAASKIPSPYGGGGAGGKFRKKTIRRQTTPYDRPPTSLHVSNINNNSRSSWLTKLVVEPASKIISYGADRLFGSVLRRRLTLPLQQPQPEVNTDVRDADRGEDLDGQDSAREPGNGDCRKTIISSNSQDGAQEPGDSGCRQPMNSSTNNVVLELEQLFKQKTFDRSEIIHLTELLQSRAVDGSPEDINQRNENVSEFGSRQAFASGLLSGNRNAGISPVISTPVRNSKFLEESIATPAELAKAYMGSRPSKVSPSDLGMRGQFGREEVGLLTNLPFTSKSPTMSLTKKASMGLSAPENGFATPRSRSRSAIHNMARTPYTRVHPTSALKGSGSNNNDYAGPSTSLYLPPVENNEKFESQPVSLKRRSSVIDDEVASVGPVRRIKQRYNLLNPRFHHSAQGVGVGPQSKQKLEQFDDRRNNRALKGTVEHENLSFQSTSYAHVPSRSSEVAAKILQQLEKLSPKEKSSESKLLLKQTPSMLSGQALRSTEDVGSSKLALNVQDVQKFGEGSMLRDARDSSVQKQANEEDNHKKTSVFSSSLWNSVSNNDSSVTLWTSNLSTETTNLIKNGASQPSQRKRDFRMNAEEDSSVQDDVQFNGLAPRSLSESKGPISSLLTNSNHASDEEKKFVKTTFGSADEAFSRTNEASDSGEGKGVVVFPASEETRETSRSEAFVPAFTAFNKPNEANNSPLFSFRPKVSDKFAPLPVESTKRAETEAVNSSSMENISASAGSQLKKFESDKGFHLNLPKLGDQNGKSNIFASAASNGPPVSSFSNGSFPTNDKSTGSAPQFSSSSSITNFVSTGTSTSTTTSGIIFGSTAFTAPVFKIGSSVDPSTAVSAASTPVISEVTDQRSKNEISSTSGSSTISHCTVAPFAATSGNTLFGLSSLTGNNLQGPLFGSSDSKSSTSGVGSVSQGLSSQLFSAASAPAFNVDSGTSLSSSPFPSFGLNPSASSSSPNPFAPSSPNPFAPASGLLNSGTSTSEGSAVTVTTSASPGFFSFSQSSSTTTTVAATPPTPNFGGAFSGINTGSSLSSGTSGTFNLGQKSPVFSSTFTSSSAAAPTTGFIFGASSTVVSPSPIFSFSNSSASAPASTPTSIFGNSSPLGGGFAASPGNDQMSAEDSMAEDPAPSPVFGQPSASQVPVFGQAFGSTAPSQTSPFVFSGQTAFPFQGTTGTGSVEFNGVGGSFSLGSGGVDKSNRKIIRVNKSKNRKK